MLEPEDGRENVENVRVFIRIRPLLTTETNDNKGIITSDTKTISFSKLENVKSFQFSKVFDEETSQIDLYRTIAVPIVEKVLNGYNGTIFAYGQSGSEIYNEEVRDLLSETPNKKLTVHEKTGLGVYVKDLLGYTVDSLEGATEILMKGNKKRSVGSTKTQRFESKNNLTKKTIFGKLNLVDLAGSERIKKTLATGDRLKEARKINLSLSVLGNVISALVVTLLTAMVATVSPKEEDYDESLYTVMYADRVKHIQNRVSVNLEKKSVIETFEHKIQELQVQLDLLSLQEQKEIKKKSKKSKTRLDDDELENIEIEKSILENKIHTIQKKILIGGENLLQKAQQQIESLEDTERQLEHLDSSHQLLEEILHFKGQEKSIVEKQYATLQEEDRELDGNIEETEKLIAKAAEVLIKKENEYQYEIEALLHTNKSLAKEMALVNYIINNSIPKEYLEKVRSNLVWVEDIQEWQIKGVAHCGNNLKKRRGKNKDLRKSDDNPVFFDYIPKK
ncbi:hypothetical protein NQ317_014764 [Molorchus minor]|uniref:Kinesin-like protein n=1 Tax=Molorchus minor TaxID=1323400 RepID=A0ABQ9J1Q8_9CUCU|nr:hypothetical protein NQ317_014764 [Molorchus minor]